MTIRVVHWTTGVVAQAAVRAVLAQPDLELIGCYAWSPDKVGKDVGELCGLAPPGVTATGNIDAIISLSPMWCCTCRCCGMSMTWCVF